MSNTQKIDISVCIMTLGRESIYRTLESVFSQNIDAVFEVVIVLQGNLDTGRIEAINPRKIPYVIHTYPHGLGFGYYRNRCIDHASGDILAWIDDDEWTMDNMWLENLTRPIRDGRYQVTTSGCHIPLGQGYMTDCISLLGWPGGGALGFEKVWRVFSDGTTRHLCGGNFAANRKALTDVGNFDERCVYSCDDTHLAWKMQSMNYLLFYIKSATIYHTPRTSKDFSKWISGRRKGMGDYMKISNNGSLTIDKVCQLWNFFRYLFPRVWYYPGYVVLGLLIFLK